MKVKKILLNLFFIVLALFMSYNISGAVEFAEKKDDIIKKLTKSAPKKALTKGLNLNKDLSVESAAESDSKQSEKPRVAANILFKYNSTEILPQSLTVLNEYGSALNDEKLRKARICVEGHTDSDGGADYNMALSNRRAQAVVDYLVKKCDVSRERLSIRGWGEERPIDNNSTEAGKQKNRRVEFLKLD